MNLAMAYSRLGEHNKEKNLLECALEIEEQHFGEAHFEVAKTLTNLANAHGDLGDPSKQKNLRVLSRYRNNITGGSTSRSRSR